MWNSDGEHGIFLKWTWADSLLDYYNQQPFKACCYSCVCHSVYSKQDSILDRNAETSHWVLWRRIKVSVFFFSNGQWKRFEFFLCLIWPICYFLFEQGVQRLWWVFMVVQVKLSWRQYVNPEKGAVAEIAGESFWMGLLLIKIILL